MNHFAAVCFRHVKKQVKKIDHVRMRLDSECGSELLEEDTVSCTADELFGIDTVAAMADRKTRREQDKIFATLNLHGKLMRFQVDTGATCNVISRSDLPNQARVTPADSRLRLYDETCLTPAGLHRTELRNPKTGRCKFVEFVVLTKPGATPLLGARTSQELGLVKVEHRNILSSNDLCQTEISGSRGARWNGKEDVISEFSRVFDGQLGEIEGEIHLEVDEMIQPVQLPPRKVPLTVRNDLKQELQRLVTLGVIVEEEGPTEWVSGLVIATKANGSMRLCIDPQPLNKALKRCHYPLHVLDDILPDLGDARVFSICDVQNGFWHLKLDNTSSRLTT